MFKLLHKTGKTKVFVPVGKNLYVYKKELNTYQNGGMVTVYASDKSCVINLGFFNQYNLENIQNYDLESKIDEFKNKILKTLSKENIDYSFAHEIYTSDFIYINQLYGASKEEYDNFIEFYQDYLEEKRRKREDQEAKELEEARQQKVQHLNNIVENILNNNPISGRDLLDVMLDKKIYCPIKTKGLINKFYDITIDNSYIKSSTKPTQASINNLFKYYKITLDFLKEQKEYESINEDDKKEIDNLFK